MELLVQQEQLVLLEEQLGCFEQCQRQRWFRRSCNRWLQLELLRNRKLVLELRKHKLVLGAARSSASS